MTWHIRYAGRARLIVDLIGCGRRVGVTSTSAKVIHNLLEEVEKVAAEEGVEFRGLKKSSAGNPESEFDSEHGLIDSVADNGALNDHEARLTAGMDWHYCREDAEPLDYLFIDEAGQVSLADALALSTAARNVVLLGDPSSCPRSPRRRTPRARHSRCWSNAGGEADRRRGKRRLPREDLVPASRCGGGSV